jgi:hypothetical protein
MFQNLKTHSAYRGTWCNRPFEQHARLNLCHNSESLGGYYFLLAHENVQKKTEKHATEKELHRNSSLIQ